MIKRILFPTDYSNTANNAFKYALHLANKQNAELYVIHVYDPPLISGRVNPELVLKLISKTNFQKLEQIEAYGPTLKTIQAELGLEEVNILFKVKEGLLIPGIEEAIEKNNIDLVVMGTDGEDASFHKKILGTNTVNTISRVQIPVLSIPSMAKFEHVKNILFTTLFDLKEQDTLDELVAMAETLNANIHCIHISSKDNTESVNQVYQSWKDRYKGNSINFQVFSNEEVGQAISNFIDQQKAPIDLVATFQREKSFFEHMLEKSTTELLAKKLKLPLLVYKKQPVNNL